MRVTAGWTPARAEIARFVGVAAYETAGGILIHDIFTENDNGGIWFEDTAQFERIYPMPGDLTGDEIKEYERLTVRRDDITELDEDDWNEDAELELERIEDRLEELRQIEEVDRAVFRREDMEVAGAIVTIGDDGTLRVIQGLVRPEDLTASGTDSKGADTVCSDNDAETQTVGTVPSFPEVPILEP